MLVGSPSCPDALKRAERRFIRPNSVFLRKYHLIISRCVLKGAWI
nr:MAG TPA: hypothetical protein [Caudoviricetes sp.]